MRMNEEQEHSRGALLVAREDPEEEPGALGRCVRSRSGRGTARDSEERGQEPRCDRVCEMS